MYPGSESGSAYKKMRICNTDCHNKFNNCLTNFTIATTIKKFNNCHIKFMSCQQKYELHQRTFEQAQQIYELPKLGTAPTKSWKANKYKNCPNKWAVNKYKNCIKNKLLTNIRTAPTNKLLQIKELPNKFMSCQQIQELPNK